jgi:acyl-CoA dehydrogenase
MSIRDSADLSDERPAEHETLRAILAEQQSPDLEHGYSPGLHARLTRELGLAGWTIPGEFGGLGKSQVEACAIHAELGRALYPGPFLSSFVAAGTLLAAGHQEACQRWLPRLAAGTAAGTVAAADAADLMLVPAATESGLAMFLAETRHPGLILARQLDLDLTRRISIVTFDSAPAELLAKDGAGALARAEREFLIAAAAEAAGGIGWCLDAALGYVRERDRDASSGFGQAAQLCVDLLTDMERVSAAARYAAAASDTRASDAQSAAHRAALVAGESHRRAIGLPQLRQRGRWPAALPSCLVSRAPVRRSAGPPRRSRGPVSQTATRDRRHLVIFLWSFGNYL